MVATNFLPTCKSLVAAGQCQSSLAKFQFIMCSAPVQQVHTWLTGAFTTQLTVIFIEE
jgi:hypothetical protein